MDVDLQLPCGQRDDRPAERVRPTSSNVLSDSIGTLSVPGRPTQPGRVGHLYLHLYQEYSKTVLGCKENCRYEMSVQKIVFRGHRQSKRIFETPIEYRIFSGKLTLFCYYYLPYFTHKLRINADLSSLAKWAGSDVTARPHTISFSNGCAIIPQPEPLENVSRVIINYLNMK